MSLMESSETCILIRKDTSRVGSFELLRYSSLCADVYVAWQVVSGGNSFALNVKEDKVENQDMIDTCPKTKRNPFS